MTKLDNAHVCSRAQKVRSNLEAFSSHASRGRCRVEERRSVAARSLRRSGASFTFCKVRPQVVNVRRDGLEKGRKLGREAEMEQEGHCTVALGDVGVPQLNVVSVLSSCASCRTPFSPRLSHLSSRRGVIPNRE